MIECSTGRHIIGSAPRWLYFGDNKAMYGTFSFLESTQETITKALSKYDRNTTKNIYFNTIVMSLTLISVPQPQGVGR